MSGKWRMVVSNQELCFEVGSHLLRLERCPDGWAATIDGLSVGDRFPSQAEAWLVGVQVAFALDAPAPGPVLSHGPTSSPPRDQSPESFALAASRGCPSPVERSRGDGLSREGTSASINLDPLRDLSHQ
jgi:hypothetical protein